MANAIYPKAKRKWMFPGTLGTTQGTAIDLESDTIKAALIDTGTYTYSTAHEYYSDLSGVVGTPQTITTPALLSDITFDGDNVTYTSVSGATVEAIVIYKDTGTAGTSPLIAYLDTSVTGLPVTPNGGNITVTWDAAGIFTL
jgi:hypothetical protein